MGTTLIMDYITSVSYSNLINDEPKAHFSPSRGLRREDPLLLYLFIGCTETLTTLFNQPEEIGSLLEVPIGKNPISINYLLFAYESP